MKRKSIINKAIKLLRQKGPRFFCKIVLNYIGQKLTYLQVLILPYAILRIKGFKVDCTVSELVDFAFNGCAKLIKPSQIQSEIYELVNLVSNIKPQVVVEIGTQRGGTLFLLSRVAANNGTVISIDLPNGRFGGGYFNWRVFLYKSFAQSAQRIHLVRGDSHKLDTINGLIAILEGRPIDFLFLDGDHTYEGVRKDLQMYGRLVREGGMVALHDIVVTPYRDGCNVNKLWEEIKLTHNHLEFVKDCNQKGSGLGVIYMPATVQESKTNGEDGCAYDRSGF